MTVENKAFERIRKNIEKYGQHIYIVSGGPNPRWAYSIGLSKDVGFELIMAGCAYFTNDEVVEIINAIAGNLRNDRSMKTYDCQHHGQFVLSDADATWSSKLALGLFDYYDSSYIRTLQITPDSEHWTIDTPILSRTWGPSLEPAWKWLSAQWPYPVSERSKAITNINALKGNPITEVVRWDECLWELFAGFGTEIEEIDVRSVPLGTLLGFDPSLETTTHLSIGKGIWRDADSLEWHQWS